VRVIGFETFANIEGNRDGHPAPIEVTLYKNYMVS